MAMELISQYPLIFLLVVFLLLHKSLEVSAGYEAPSEGSLNTASKVAPKLHFLLKHRILVRIVSILVLTTSGYFFVEFDNVSIRLLSAFASILVICVSAYWINWRSFLRWHKDRKS